ncbi:MAG: hypothetical protein ABI237_00090 [Ginsengibacter sp.]
MEKVINGLSLTGQYTGSKKKSGQVKNSLLKKISYGILMPGILLFFTVLFSSFVKTPVHKENTTYEKGKTSVSSKMLRREERQEKRKIKAVEDISWGTMNLFAEEFPKAQNVKWTSVKGFAEADFKSGSSSMVAFYDFENKLVGTGKYVSYNQLPHDAIKSIEKDFKNYKPEKIIYYDDNGLNENDITFFGNTIGEDDYYALMKDRNDPEKEMVLQITPRGEVFYFSGVR